MLSLAYRLIRDNQQFIWNKQNVDHCCRDIVQIFNFYWNLLILQRVFHLIWPHNKKYIIREREKIVIFMFVSHDPLPLKYTHTHTFHLFILPKIRWKCSYYLVFYFFLPGNRIKLWFFFFCHDADRKKNKRKLTISMCKVIV